MKNSLFATFVVRRQSLLRVASDREQLNSDFDRMTSWQLINNNLMLVLHLHLKCWLRTSLCSIFYCSKLLLVCCHRVVGSILRSIIPFFWFLVTCSWVPYSFASLHLSKIEIVGICIYKIGRKECPSSTRTLSHFSLVVSQFSLLLGHFNVSSIF